MPDHRCLIDARTWAFTHRNAAGHRAGAAALPIPAQRRPCDAPCRACRRPPGVAARDAPVDGVPCRHDRPAGAGAGSTPSDHGGGFVLGNPPSHEDAGGAVPRTADRSTRIVNAAAALARGDRPYGGPA